MSLVSLAMGNRVPLWFWLLFVSALVALPFPVLLPLELPLPLLLFPLPLLPFPLLLLVKSA